jgi:hypothetical protein
MEQTIIVGIIVVATVAWAVWRIVRRTDTGGCASCGSAGSCPFAAEGECPSELSDRAEERVSPEPAADPRNRRRPRSGTTHSGRPLELTALRARSVSPGSHDSSARGGGA